MVNAVHTETRITQAVNKNWKRIQEQCRLFDPNNSGEIEASQFRGGSPSFCSLAGSCVKLAYTGDKEVGFVCKRCIWFDLIIFFYKDNLNNVICLPLSPWKSEILKTKGWCQKESSVDSWVKNPRKHKNKAVKNMFKSKVIKFVN